MFRLIGAGILMTLLLSGCAPRSLGPAQAGAQVPPLHQAVLTGHADNVAQQLAKPDTEVNKTGPNGSTPLHLAAGIQHVFNQQHNGASYPNTRIVRLLLNHGADPESRHAQTRATPIHNTANADVVDALVTAGADPMARDIQDNTPLHYTTSPRVARALLRHGADPSATNIGGQTPVQTLQIRREQFTRAINNQSGGLSSLSAEQRQQFIRRQNRLIDSTIAVLTRSTDSVESARSSQAATASPADEQVDHLLIRDSSGRYLSPYTSDGVVAEWVDKAINAKMGSSVGSTAGAAAGSALASKALESVPGGSLIGGLLGSRAGQAVGREAAIDEEYMRNTSDLSFNSLDQMAQWLIRVHGRKANFAEVINATSEIYTGLKPALSRAQRQR